MPVKYRNLCRDSGGDIRQSSFSGLSKARNCHFTTYMTRILYANIFKTILFLLLLGIYYLYGVRYHYVWNVYCFLLYVALGLLERRTYK